MYICWVFIGSLYEPYARPITNPNPTVTLCHQLCPCHPIVYLDRHPQTSHPQPTHPHSHPPQMPASQSCSRCGWPLPVGVSAGRDRLTDTNLGDLKTFPSMNQSIFYELAKIESNIMFSTIRTVADKYKMVRQVVRYIAFSCTKQCIQLTERSCLAAVGWPLPSHHHRVPPTKSQTA